MSPRAASNKLKRECRCRVESRKGSSTAGQVIYTIGYGGRLPGDLIERLLDHDVEVVFDVRFRPRSRFYPWANYYTVRGDGPLRRLIEKAGMEYDWVGDVLGNPKPHESSMARFRGLMRSEGRQRTHRVRELSARRRVCLLCASKDKARCHRRLIADFLTDQGFTVVHL